MDATFAMLNDLAVDPFQQQAFADNPVAFLQAAGFTGGGPEEFERALRATLNVAPKWAPCAIVFDPGNDPSPDPDPPELRQ